ncbi:alpha/beta hydrolase family esterase [Roseovarius autotrophicus]|uniref:extracellular catalytic domain type 1 short-chain-length polyhydroxyalkanoate depolymerase n=1 Tax=Roseovarius autotrophicus TaxID=2824121 RepID=UPI001A0B5F66|nr:PHB depolymerase family esterase [Roseovarius autotrophicus]MBE0453538.1 PHB depolymerase family esterase [Roseovarius sp.]
MTDTMKPATQVVQWPGRLARSSVSFQAALSGFVVQAALLLFKTRSYETSANLGISAARKAGRTVGALIRRRESTSPIATGSAIRAGGDQTLPRIPAQAQYLTRRHRSAAGSRGYRLYLPASRPGRPRGLILMLHGCNQSPDDFALGTHMNALAEKHGLALAYPAQTRWQNRGGCWNWFKPRNQMRGTGEPAILAALTRKLMREFGLCRDDVFVAGLSAGGAMAAILADVYPDVFAAAGVHSGLARGAAWDAMSAMSAMHDGGAPNGIVASIPKRAGPVRRIIFQGTDDRTVNPLNAGFIVAAAMGGHVAPTRVGKRSVQGRDYSRSFFTDTKGSVRVELWMIEGFGHAWSGGRAAGSYTDTKGPDASAQMVRFFLDKPARDVVR